MHEAGKRSWSFTVQRRLAESFEFLRPAVQRYKVCSCIHSSEFEYLFSKKKSTYGTSLGVELQETPISSLAFPLYTIVVCFVVLLFCTCVSGTFVANAYFLQLLLVKYYVTGL